MRSVRFHWGTGSSANSPWSPARRSTHCQSRSFLRFTMPRKFSHGHIGTFTAYSTPLPVASGQKLSLEEGAIDPHLEAALHAKLFPFCTKRLAEKLRAAM